ncbi:histidyl-tRNA synthetase [Hokovirus HKV1]|uniref:Histidyl-tRNA synthetase n=1 Tax=Hokovirus HKV1 TaxID=1977638 RepID=A0A1V0SFH3_9VIRU|nr:histidyl-tRNA synthetase [Hokovirus HKV1]
MNIATYYLALKNKQNNDNNQQQNINNKNTNKQYDSQNINNNTNNNKQNNNKQNANKQQNHNKQELIKITSDPLEGFQDNHDYLQNYILTVWQQVAQLYCFKNYDIPYIERTELYTIKSGEDIVKEMITFKILGNDVCLKPENTPSLVRMVSNMKIDSPERFYNISKNWRFETVTTERKREFYQLNCDIVADNSINAELELLSMLVNIFEKLNIKNIKIRFSHRSLINTWLLECLNIEQDKLNDIIKYIDKIDKIQNFDLKNLLTDEQINKLLYFINIKNPLELQQYNNETINKYVIDIMLLLNLSNNYYINEYLIFDLKIVRGINYYTGIVFECFAKDSKRAICGGGRYDNIMKTMNLKKNYEFVGFGLGLNGLLKLVNDIKPRIEYGIITTVPNLYDKVCGIVTIIRKKNIQILPINKFKLTQALKCANKLNINKCIIIMQNEYLNGEFIIKDLVNNTQNTVNIDDFLNSL